MAALWFLFLCNVLWSFDATDIMSLYDISSFLEDLYSSSSYWMYLSSSIGDNKDVCIRKSFMNSSFYFVRLFFSSYDWIIVSSNLKIWTTFISKCCVILGFLYIPTSLQQVTISRAFHHISQHISSNLLSRTILWTHCPEYPRDSLHEYQSFLLQNIFGCLIDSSLEIWIDPSDCIDKW